MAEYYTWYKAIHVISVIFWMAGLLYLPRLYAYHARAEVGGELDKTFQTMERRLLKIIMNPAMLVTYIFGLMNAHIYGFVALGGWFHIKMLAVGALTIMHMYLAKCRKDFVRGENKNSERFYRIINEIPAILIVIAVIMVIVKPFE